MASTSVLSTSNNDDHFHFHFHFLISNFSFLISLFLLLVPPIMTIYRLDCACAAYSHVHIKLSGGSPPGVPKRNEMEVEVGLRVVRGPDWQWGDQDGGEGCLGTITGMGDQGNDEGALPQVLWDYGYRSNNYRCGNGLFHFISKHPLLRSKL